MIRVVIPRAAGIALPISIPPAAYLTLLRNNVPCLLFVWSQIHTPGEF
jgi:hypothetical protein